MTTYAERIFTSSDGLELYYRDYADASGNEVAALCLPGLTRTSRDFADLAEYLAARRRVVCPDLRGRGRSAYDPQPANYHPGVYVRDVIDLLHGAGEERVVVIGTSLGGLMALMMTATRPDAVAGVLLNDIGPEVDPAGLDRIRGYVGRGSSVSSWEAAAEAVRSINAAVYPTFRDADWLAMAHRLYVPDPEGGFRPDYDPRIADNFASEEADAPDLWPLYATLAGIPTLAVRGERSDILSPEVLARMAREKPDLQHLTVEGRGHAPLLTEPECLRAIDSWLSGVSRGGEASDFSGGRDRD